MADTKRYAMIGAMWKGPGPAKYKLPGTTGAEGHDFSKHKKPQWSFGLRTTQKQESCSPGPKFLIAKNFTRHGADPAPKWTIKYRTNLQGSFQNPAPWAYSPEKQRVYKHKFPPQISFGLRTPYGKKDNTPAPNNYNLPGILGPKAVGKKSSAAYSMTPRSKIGSFHEDLQRTPGPGTYKVTDPNVYKDKKPGYYMNGRNNVPGDGTQKPGPGAHSPEKVYVTKRIAPKFSFGIRHSEYLAPLITDPID